MWRVVRNNPNAFSWRYFGVSHPEYASLSVRIESFKECPFKYMEPIEFASAGFFYDSDPRLHDKVRCLSCGHAFHLWEPGECPFQEHAIYNPIRANLYLKRGFDFIKKATSNNPILLIQESDRQTPSYPKCVICMENDVGVMYAPCNHVVTCRSCGASVSQCPLCRTNIVYVCRLYLA